jgi:hypothetical protein
MTDCSPIIVFERPITETIHPHRKVGTGGGATVPEGAAFIDGLCRIDADFRESNIRTAGAAETPDGNTVV